MMLLEWHYRKINIIIMTLALSRRAATSRLVFCECESTSRFWEIYQVKNGIILNKFALVEVESKHMYIIEIQAKLDCDT